jgi:hypothetical protein
VPQEIADKFPAMQIAEGLRGQIDDALRTLPITEFEKKANTITSSMGTFIKDAKASQDTIERELSRLQKNAADIANLGIPSVSWWRDFGFLLGGGILASLVMWWFVVKADEAQMKSMVGSEGFIGTRAVAGYYNDEPIIMIPKDNLKDAKIDPATGNLMVHLNK